MNIFKKFLYEGEPLEFNLKEQILKKKINFLKIYIFFIKLFRVIYKSYQRFFLKPSTRLIFQKFEKFFLLKKYYKNTDNILITKQSRVLNNTGYLEIDSIFSKDELRETIDYLSEDHLLEPIYSDHKKFYLSNPPKGVKTGYLSSEVIIKSKHILKAINNPNFLSLLKDYFNCSFKLDWVWSWWSFPAEDLAGPQQFHRDYESMNFIKVFVYLTDVDQHNGPHSYIRGSHKIDRLYERKRFSDEIINKNFNDDEKLSILGKKGSTFIVNTFGIHKGMAPIKNNRLVLVYLFSVIPSNRSPKIPPVNFSDIEAKQKDMYLKNKEIFNLFIDFKN